MGHTTIALPTDAEIAAVIDRMRASSDSPGAQLLIDAIVDVLPEARQLVRSVLSEPEITRHNYARVLSMISGLQARGVGKHGVRAFLAALRVAGYPHETWRVLWDMF